MSFAWSLSALAAGQGSSSTAITVADAAQAHSASSATASSDVNVTAADAAQAHSASSPTASSDVNVTAADLWWWQLCVQTTNTVFSGTRTYVDLAFGDATNKELIQRQMIVNTANEDMADVWRTNLSLPDCYRPVPAGSTLYVRGRAGAAPETGWNANAIGIGG